MSALFPLTESFFESTVPASLAKNWEVLVRKRGTEAAANVYGNEEGAGSPVAQPLFTGASGRVLVPSETNAFGWVKPADLPLDIWARPKGREDLDWQILPFGDLVAAGGQALEEVASKITSPEGAAQSDTLVYDGGNWARLPVGTKGQQVIVRNDGTVKYINAPDIYVDAWSAKGDDSTDNTAALESAFKRAEEIGGNVRFGNGIYQAQAGKLGVYCGGVSVSGVVKGRSTLKVKEGEGFLLTIGRKNGTPMQQENHSDCNTLRNMQLDGNARIPDAGGLNCEAQQFCTIDNVFSAHFKRQAARFTRFRESVINNLYCRTSGTSGQYPQVHFDDSAAGQECCNNVFVYGLRSVGHAWHGLAIEGNSSGEANGPLRNIFFFGAMLHGAAFPFPYETAEGYTYSNEAALRPNGHNLLVKDARNVVFYSPRFNAPGRGFAAVRIAKGVAGASTVNGLILKNPSYGSPNSYATNLGVTVSAATDTLTTTGGELWLQTGAVVTVASTGTLPAGLAAATEYWAIRVSDNAVKLATTREKAEAGEAIDLTSAGTGTISITPRWINVDHEFGIAGSLQLDRGEITPSGETGATVVNRTGNNEAIGTQTLGQQNVVVLNSERRALVVQVESQAQPRFYIDGQGSMWWGPDGTILPARLLYSPSEKVLRIAATTLTIDGTISANGVALNVAGQLIHTGTKTGLNGATPVAKAAAITSPAAELAALKTAVDKLREVVKNVGLTE